jgi:transcriptional regulator with XRE-family HTH domain
VVIKLKDKKLLKAFGHHIRKLREDRDMSQEDVANLADIPLSQVGRTERGEQNSTILTHSAIAKALKVDLDELYRFGQNKK